MEKFSSILGLIIALVLILVSMGDFGAFIDIPSIMIVVGGTIGTTLMTAGISGVLASVKTLMFALTQTDSDAVDTLATVYKLAVKARKKNILALEEDCLSLEDEFLKKGLQLVIDGISPDIIADVMGKEIESANIRHMQSQSVLNFVASTAPSMGKTII